MDHRVAHALKELRTNSSLDASVFPDSTNPAHNMLIAT
jgi:hypothetical protein